MRQLSAYNTCHHLGYQKWHSLIRLFMYQTLLWCQLNNQKSPVRLRKPAKTKEKVIKPQFRESRMRMKFSTLEFCSCLAFEVRGSLNKSPPAATSQYVYELLSPARLRALSTPVPLLLLHVGSSPFKSVVNNVNKNKMLFCFKRRLSALLGGS